MSLKIFLRKHVGSLLAIIVLVFLLIVVGSYVWGIGYIANEANQAANSSPSANQTIQFDISDAAKIDYRGTLHQ
jgi:CHASE3 domain sensor protein